MEKVLIVNGSPAECAALSIMLGKKHQNYVAYDTVTALEIYELAQLDIVVVNYKLRNERGESLIQQNRW